MTVFYLSKGKLQRQQTANIVMITFWSQFSAIALNTILILFLTKPLLMHGLGYSQAQAYAFVGIYHATGYLMPIIGGVAADRLLGLRRSILLGSVLVAIGYLCLMLSQYSIANHGDVFFLAAIALLPTANSLLMGTASGMLAHIYTGHAVKAKTAMTYYYMAINVGALLSTFIAPALLESRYGALSVFAFAFVGKAMAALNFAYRYAIYDNVAYGPDCFPLPRNTIYKLIAYILALYSLTVLAFAHDYYANIIISIGCVCGILWFLSKTLGLKGASRTKQLIGLLLIIEAIVFFVIYNQMNTTLVLFAQKNSNNILFGQQFSPAHYQILNPLLIIGLGLQLPLFYKTFPRFSIPYQFAAGTLLAGIALLILALAPAQNGMISPYLIALTYLFISLAELWVSAIGLSMIGLYCDNQNLGFAMGTWYLASSLSNTLSGRIAQWIAMPEQYTDSIQSLEMYQSYYQNMGLVACTLGITMVLVAYGLHHGIDKRLTIF